MASYYDDDDDDICCPNEYCAFHDFSEVLVDRTLLMLFLFSITILT